MAEAFRLTVEDHPDRVAVRTKDDEVSLTWAQLRDRVDALAGGLAGLGVRRGDTVALMIGNRPEFHVADLAAMTLGATPFSIYPTFTPAQIAYVVGDAGAKVAIVDAAHPRGVPRRARRAAGARDGDRARGRRRARTRVAWDAVEGADPGFDAEPHWRASGPRTSHADLHLGHDGAAQGRPARAPQPHGHGQGGRRRPPLPRRLEGHLVAAGRAHRRAQRAPLPADRLRDDDHDVPEPARDRRLPAGRQADVVLRGAAHLREAQGRARGPSLHAEGEQTVRLARPRRAARSSSSRPASPCPRTSRPRRRRATRSSSPALRAMLGLDEALAVHAGAAPTPRDVLVFFHAIGIPLGGAVGDVGDVRRRRRQPDRRRPDRHRRARRRWASSSSWPTTASCSCAATS